MTRGLTGREIALRAQMAALLEVSAPKPGNVSRYHDFGDTSFEDFLTSAVAVGAAFDAVEESSLGSLIERGVTETRRWVRTNTNLGIVLLFAPLACAAARGYRGSLRERLASVLADTTIDDARAAYAAIRLARPGGLGSVPEQDVNAEPTVTLREAMVLAADRDAIAREYVTDYATTFDTAVPALRRARLGAAWPSAITDAFLTLLAARPDTLIARKAGVAAAKRVSGEAAAVLDAGESHSPERAAAIVRLDRRLRSAGNRLNPGATADLIAAAIFVVLLEDGAGVTM
ncbi:MAG: triphosphoribosyl-dephospho-CoA synthase [Longimicrobiales bacterium]